MKALSTATSRLQSVVVDPSRLITRLQSSWVAYLAWRLERQAALQLEALSDRELQDIGLRRCEIEGAVKGALERERAFYRRY